MNLKYTSSVVAVLAAIGVFSPAHAADIYTKPSEAYVQPASAKPSFTGFYVGGRIGLGKDRHELTVDEYEDVPSCGEGTIGEDGASCAPAEYVKPLAEDDNVKRCNGKVFEGTKDACQALGDGTGKAGLYQSDSSGPEKNCRRNDDGAQSFKGGCSVDEEEVPVSPKVGADEVREASCTNGGTLADDFLISKQCTTPDFVADASQVAKRIFKDTLTDSDIFYGGTVGADIQKGRFIFGAFAYYDMGETSTGLGRAGFDGVALENDGEWAIGGRVGYAIDPRLAAFISAAYKEVSINATGENSADFNDVTVTGLEAGIGLEYLVLENFSLGIEYTHFFGGEKTILNTCAAEGCAAGDLNVKDDFSQDKIMLIGRVRFN